MTDEERKELQEQLKREIVAEIATMREEQQRKREEEAETKRRREHRE